MGLFDTGANLPDLPNIDKWLTTLDSSIQKFGERGDAQAANFDSRYEQLYGLVDALIQQYAPEVGKSYDFGSELRDIYRAEALPMERQFVRDAQSYDTTARREGKAAEAMSGVTSAAEANRRRAAMELQRYGIDPTDPRYAAIASQGDPATAAATSAAANNARERVEDRGLAMRRQAIDVGKSWDQQSGQWIDRGGMIGEALPGAMEGAIRSDAAVRGRSSDWYQQQMQTLQQMIDTQMQRYNAKLGRTQARSAAGAGAWQGFGQLAGMGIGAALAAPTGGMSMLAGAQLGGMIGGAGTQAITGTGTPPGVY